ncbi:PTS system beta-glucosides-specific IIC component [Lactobacillus colini]|uniref:PTS system beta-glucosides-specific IIC component n=1 Tax=Lactobacillus colini TaxID=1819254 RepID=A0ABS4MGQ9_9LACO|nr:beta-glucoside-specific PTS transporter subunit IIABC [Lactobacillus colini]MBP2058886.1 PTS system beta-glucosides-specific IIC component [Lactobacillus colini]
MAKSYTTLATNIVKFVGGKGNINSVFHCATRLRFQLKDIDIAKSNTEKIKSLYGVLDVVVQNGQYQIVIGPNVGDVFEFVQKEVGEISSTDTSNKNEQKSKFDRFFEIVSGLFTPVVPVLMASGMMGAVLVILNLLGWLPQNSSTYHLLDVVYQAGFYFLPFFIAASSAKVFKANRYLAMLLAGIMLYPQLFSFKGKLLLLNLAVPKMDYGKSVLSVILGVWLLSYIERTSDKFMPDIVKSFMTPLITMAIMLPVQLIVIGPLGAEVANYLSVGVQWMGDNLGFFAVGILAFFTPLMIATGTHSFAFPVIVATITSLGYDQLLMPSMVAENLAMAGAAMGIALISNDKSKKSNAISASVTALLGISEPAMYGFVIPSGYGFIGAMLGGLVGGIFGGIFKFKMYMIASSSLIGIPAMFGKNSGYGNVIVGCIEIIISFICAMFFTMVLSKSKFSINSFINRHKKDKKVQKQELEASQSSNTPVALASTTVVSPLEGQLIRLSEVDDQVFASGAMGKGCAVEPSEGLVKSPVNGMVVLTYKTGHAIGLKSEDGAEILIHIGMDTVNLNGKGFKVLAKENQKVQIGDPLVEVDWNLVKKSGYKITTSVIITNSDQYKEIKVMNFGKVHTGQEILELNQKEDE